MDRIIQSPGKYIQGAAVLSRLGDYLKPLAERWLVVGDKFVLGFTQESLHNSLSAAGLGFEIVHFGSECSQNEIDRLRAVAEKAGCDAVVGIGGGKTLDTAKALAHYMAVPVAIVPTIASTDAPCSALSVIYTDDGEFERYLLLPHNPNMVIVDTQIVAGAPSRLLAAGIGDAPVHAAAQPPWLAASVPRRRWPWRSSAITRCWNRAKKRCWQPNSMWSRPRWSALWKPILI